MHRFPHLIVATERERDIGNTTRNLRTRKVFLDPTRRVDEVQCVVVVLLDTRRNRQDIGIENDVVLIETDLIHQNPISPFTNPDLLIIGRRLAFFVKRHHHHSRAVFHDMSGIILKSLFPLFKRNRVHDSLALKMFQTLFQNLPFRGIDHDGHPCHIRFALEQIEILRHHRFAVDEAIIETDIDHVGAIRHLLTRHFDRRLQITHPDQLRKLRRPRHVRPLPDHQETFSFVVVISLRPGEPECWFDWIHGWEKF